MNYERVYFQKDKIVVKEQNSGCQELGVGGECDYKGKDKELLGVTEPIWLIMLVVTWICKCIRI